MTQYYNIAGLIVEMDTFGRTAEQAKSYITLCKRMPDIVVKGNAEDFKARYPHFTLDDSEYMSTGSSFYRQLIDHDGILLHSSAVVVDGKAYIFSAPSGTGKSTHTQMYLKHFGDRAAILNDDKPAIRLIDGEFCASGTPWSGKTDWNINLTVPIAGICMLRRGEVNKIVPHTGSKALFDILEQTLRPKSADSRDKLISLLTKLIEKVPIWKLECNMDPEAAIVSYEAMSGGKAE